VPYETALPANLPVMPKPEDLCEGGYGLALIASAVDRLEYERMGPGTNHWRLVKFLSDPAHTG